MAKYYLINHRIAQPVEKRYSNAQYTKMSCDLAHDLAHILN